MEIQLDKAAVALGIDPIELRRRNDIGSDTRTVNEFRVGSNGFRECLDRVEAASGWRDRRAALPYGRGLGVAGSTYISGTNYPIYPNEMPQAGVQVCLDRSGRARVFSGANDIGQGSNTMLAVITSEELGLPIVVISLLTSVQAATRLFAPYGWGWLSDHTGERVKLLRFSATVALELELSCPPSTGPAPAAA